MKISDRKFDTLLMIVTALASIIFSILSNLETGFLAGLSVGGLFLIIYTKWNCSRNWWFWLTIAVFIILHAIALWTIKLPPVSHGMTYAPIAFIDMFAMWGILNGLEALFKLGK